MSQFINRKEDIVAEAVDGLVAASGGRLARLDGYPHVRAVLRADWDRSKVALVSGGGSGHEPAHAGLVGRGMLTAGVCGEVFASPSVDAVLAGILAVTGDPGCLLIITNYTGDRLNFGLAAERARALGRDVEVVFVDDDIALPDLPQARGISGTLILDKIIGAMAEDGADLRTLAETARSIVSRTRSIGMALDTCRVPGAEKEDRIPAGKAELGLGIHGEAGVEQVDFSDARSAMAMVAGKLAEQMDADEPYVALLNNLGGTSVLEMQVLAHELVNSKIGDRLSHLIGPATLMTSLEMHGFSVSVFPASPDELAALEAGTEVRVWPGIGALLPVETVPLPGGLRPERAAPSENAEARALVARCCEILAGAEKDLNALDARAGDGDTGSTLATAARALQKAAGDLPYADEPQLLRAIGLELSQSMGGSSGVLLAIFFAAAGDAAGNGAALPEALRAGLARMQEIGGAELGDRTMIDALHPALEKLGEADLTAAARAAREGADGTAEMTSARAGRAAYVGADHLRGHVDPGAEAVARLFEQLSAAPAD